MIKITSVLAVVATGDISTVSLHCPVYSACFNNTVLT